MARTPLYKAAETEMIRRIEAGEWEVGKRLPNEFVLAEEFKVSQGTMRRALMTLEGMGLLNRKPGRGTLVARPAPAASGRRWGTGSCRTAPGHVRVHRAKSGLRGADAAEAALFGTGRLSHVERLLKRGGARAGTRISPSPKASRPRWTRTHRWTSQSSWPRTGCGPPDHRNGQRRHHVDDGIRRALLRPAHAASGGHAHRPERCRRPSRARSCA
jgi:hypothetical protein